jgi:hypothetical protein
MKPQFTETKVFLSLDYNLFKFFNFNRPVDKNHVATLVESMRRWGFTSTITVIKTDVIDGQVSFYILDGQHRIKAAQILGIPFRFDIVDIKTKLELAQFIADVNNSAKAWGTNQFLNVWAKMQITEYVKLLDVQNKTNIQITPLVKAYTNKTAMTDFRKGEMKFVDEANSDKIIEQIVDLNDYLPNKAFCRRAIIDVMNRPDYNHELVKPIIVRRAKTTGFTENEKDLKAELEMLVRASNVNKPNNLLKVA